MGPMGAPLPAPSPGPRPSGSRDGDRAWTAASEQQLFNGPLYSSAVKQDDFMACKMASALRGSKIRPLGMLHSSMGEFTGFSEPETLIFLERVVMFTY